MANISMKIVRDLESAPGARIVLRRLTEGRRMELRSKIGGFLAQIRGLGAQIDALMSGPEEAREYEKIILLQDQIEKIQHDDIDPAWLRWGVARVEGLMVEDVEMSLDTIFDWPSDVYAEALELVRESASLGAEARKNSSSPTTTSDQGDAVPNPLTA